jgi:ferredoxin
MGLKLCESIGSMNDSPSALRPTYIARIPSRDAQVDCWPDQPLLIALELGGVDWPSSCRNGTCRTCVAQLSSGQVRYEIEWPGLSAEEKQEGYILPCVAYPCGDLVLAG